MSLKQTSLSLQDLSYKDRHWHSECFLCIKCSHSLVDRPFAAKDDMLMCVECYSHEYSSKCHACLKTIMPGRSATIGGQLRKLSHRYWSVTFEIEKKAHFLDLSFLVSIAFFKSNVFLSIYHILSSKSKSNKTCHRVPESSRAGSSKVPKY